MLDLNSILQLMERHRIAIETLGCTMTTWITLEPGPTAICHVESPQVIAEVVIWATGHTASDIIDVLDQRSVNCQSSIIVNSESVTQFLEDFYVDVQRVIERGP